MLLPNGDRAVVDSAKLRDYCLSPVHPRGKHKARLFAAKLGWVEADWPVLQVALREAASTAEARLVRSDGYGEIYEIVSQMSGPAGSSPVLSVWINEPADNMPRLITCYPV